MLTALRFHRQKQGLKIIDVSKKLGIHETLLSKIEKGQHYVPTKWREKLAEFYDVNADKLFDSKGWPIVIEDK